MEIKIKQSKPKESIPAIGQPWCLTGDREVYIRVGDAKGAKALGYTVPDESVFYSVSLSSGYFVYTQKESKVITLLSPVGGVVEFEPAN